jgi:hypothetical protein
MYCKWDNCVEVLWASIYCEIILPKLLIKLLLIFSITCVDYTNTNLILLIDTECLIQVFCFIRTASVTDSLAAPV